jgi:23S rRNA (cytosine1962-C5)-methyltransferase
VRRRSPRIEAATPEVRLVRRLERTLGQGHPWIWRDALAPHGAAAGEVVTVVDRRGAFVARGIADDGPIGVRVLTTDAREPVDDALLGRRIAQAAALRDRVVPPATSSYRLLHGEGDRLPGVVCDVYGAVAVLSCDGRGAAAWRDRLVGALRAPLAARGVTALLERRGRRSASRDEEAEAAAETTRALFGALPAGPIEVSERGMILLADVVRGQKTGLFLDHRDTRQRVRELASGARVLDLFGYTGGFSVAAGRGGAACVDTVDLAAPALALAVETWAANALAGERHRVHRADVFAFLAAARARADRWELVIADPPSFAPSARAVPAAIAAYRKLHAACLGVLAPGGLYLAASCSSHVRRDAFEATLVGAAERARRPLAILGAWGAAADHPRLAAFPEGDYLKVVLASG